MAYPIIILGAGASHDYDDSTFKDGVFPLANKLLNPNGLGVEETLRDFPELSPLASGIHNTVSSPNEEGLEDYLGRMKAEAIDKKDYDIQRGLISLEFYLQKLFQKLSNERGKKPINNYENLIAAARRFLNNNKEDQVCFANFNYDLLLEQGGLGRELNNEIENRDGRLNAYISNRIKVIKLHGSCDWGYPIDKITEHQFSGSFSDSNSIYKFFIENPDRIINHRNDIVSINKEKDFPIYRTQEHRIIRSPAPPLYLCPAIAIPLPQKDDFVCPKSHIDVLKDAFKKTDRILMIGWSAGDKNLINLMKESIKQPVRVTIVARDDEDVKKIKENIDIIRQFRVDDKSIKHGFRNFLGNRGHEKFFGLV